MSVDEPRDELEEAFVKRQALLDLKIGPPPIPSDDALALAVCDTDRVRSLLSAGTSVTPYALVAVARSCVTASLELMMGTGIDANLRFSGADRDHNGVNRAWASSGHLSPKFRKQEREWYALQHAAYTPSRIGEIMRRNMASTMATLLAYKADPYAIFRQPLRFQQLSYFPGEKNERGVSDSDDEWEEVDGQGFPFTHPPHSRLYGLRSVIHAILEDGAYSQPFLSDSYIHKLNVEHRDPQGRTLILSACRSALGADADINAVLEDHHWDGEKGAMAENVFNGSQNSLFYALQAQGADLHAVDILGKNALHSLLESHDEPWTRKPAIIHCSLKYVLEHCPALIDQPDKQGTYPLHAGFQRWRRFPVPDKCSASTALETAIDDLLAADADPLVRDGHRNTALHYLADIRLGDFFQGDEHRRLFRVFLNHGVDINARNIDGRSALDLFLDDASASEERDFAFHSAYNIREEWHNRDVTKLDRDVFGYFEDAGVNWTGLTCHGQTALHIVAKHDTETAPFRVEWLLSKGIDPDLKDDSGKTAVDIAESRDLNELLEDGERNLENGV